VIFNDGAYNYAVDKELRAERTVNLEHGKPLVFGKDQDKGIRLHGMVPEVVSRPRENFSGYFDRRFSME
jgi:2-oxoglutarate ferredoxin oxidoreductase subunit beta